MRRLIMWNLITLDGHFEGPQHWETLLEARPLVTGAVILRYQRGS